MSIKNIKEFSNLFKINIPYEKEFQYYIETLSLSNEYKDLSDLVKAFVKFETWIEDNNFGSIEEYKMGHAQKRIRRHIENSIAYERFQNFDYSNFKFSKKDNLKNWYAEQIESNNPELLLSVDLSSANFNTIREFDEEGVLGNSWEELCKKLFIHPVLSQSKNFRQYIFGKLDSKRNGKIQLTKINRLSNHLVNYGYGDMVVRISNDELLISVPADDYMSVLRPIEKGMYQMGFISPVKKTVYAIKKIGKESYKQVILYQDGLNKEDRYTKLSGVQKNKYYKTFKKEILDKEVEERDVLFILDGDLAKWVDYEK